MSCCWVVYSFHSLPQARFKTVGDMSTFAGVLPFSCHYMDIKCQQAISRDHFCNRGCPCSGGVGSWGREAVQGTLTPFLPWNQVIGRSTCQNSWAFYCSYWLATSLVIFISEWPVESSLTRFDSTFSRSGVGRMTNFLVACIFFFFNRYEPLSDSVTRHFLTWWILDAEVLWESWRGQEWKKAIITSPGNNRSEHF